MMPDNTRYLRAAEQQRRARLIDQAREAIRRLDDAGDAITVAAVVRASGAFRYRVPNWSRRSRGYETFNSAPDSGILLASA
ncbi:hypothetical protein [Nonomuraea sp. NPDC049400]|uniref:hypothetical protein n=1 Tax=Nonomuraea sp. NPDC049400 TaxID=3364352 RepID=UPI003797E52E